MSNVTKKGGAASFRGLGAAAAAADDDDPSHCPECGLQLHAENQGIMLNCYHVKCYSCFTKAKAPDGKQLCYQCYNNNNNMSSVHVDNEVEIESVTLPSATKAGASSSSSSSKGMAGIRFGAPPPAAKPAFVRDHEGEELSVKIARNRFKNALNNCILAKLSKEKNGLTNLTAEELARYGATTGESPAGSSTTTQPPQHVITFFNRKVNLNQFNEKTPLYPMLRSWILNKPQLTKMKTVEENELAAGLNSIVAASEGNPFDGEVHKLPPPEPLPLDEFGNPINLRIPPPLPQPRVEFDINYDVENAPDPAILFRDHLERWGVVRQRWKEARAYNEARYKKSFAILEQMHTSAKINSIQEEPNATPTRTPAATVTAIKQEMAELDPLVDPLYEERMFELEQQVDNSGFHEQLEQDGIGNQDQELQEGVDVDVGPQDYHQEGQVSQAEAELDNYEFVGQELADEVQEQLLPEGGEQQFHEQRQEQNRVNDNIGDWVGPEGVADADAGVEEQQAEQQQQQGFRRGNVDEHFQGLDDLFDFDDSMY